MHTSTSNTTHELQKTHNERDLGVILSDNGKVQDQVSSAVAKANSMMAILKNTFVSRDIYVWKILYIAYICPHLEFVVATWNPHLKRDISALERVPRRATKIPRANKKTHI
jgi:hypothetical protein